MVSPAQRKKRAKRRSILSPKTKAIQQKSLQTRSMRSHGVGNRVPQSGYGQNPGVSSAPARRHPTLATTNQAQIASVKQQLGVTNLPDSVKNLIAQYTVPPYTPKGRGGRLNKKQLLGYDFTPVVLKLQGDEFRQKLPANYGPVRHSKTHDLGTRMPLTASVYKRFSHQRPGNSLGIVLAARKNFLRHVHEASTMT